MMTEFQKRHRIAPRPSANGDRWQARLRGTNFQRFFG
jgi:hypothetical protein